MPKDLDQLLFAGAARFNALRDEGSVGADHTGATLRRLFCARADLSQLVLIGSEWEDCELSDVDFTGSELTNAWIHGGRFERCRFTGATLAGAVFENVDLVECDFTAARGLESLDWSSARLHEARGLAVAEGVPAAPSFVPGRVAHHVEWEASLAANPDDEQLWQVYGDWLLGQGDLRGELVARHRSAKTEGEFAAFVDEHLDLLFRDCVDEVRGGGQMPELLAEWRHGFLSGATLRSDNPERRINLARLATRVLALPVARFVRRLSFGIVVAAQVDGDEEVDYSEVIEVFRKNPRAPELTHLEFGLQPRLFDSSGEHYNYDPLQGYGDLSALWPLVPQLRSLRVLGAGGVLGPLVLPNLQSFALQNDSLEEPGAMQELLTAKWPRLERLELTDVNGALDVRALLSACEGLRLTHLGVLESAALDKVLMALVSSPVLRGLRVLDVRGGSLSGHGLAFLQANVAAFRHLERLDVSGLLQVGDLSDLARLGAFMVLNHELEVEVDHYGLAEENLPEADWDFVANAPFDEAEPIAEEPVDPRADLDIPDENDDQS